MVQTANNFHHAWQIFVLPPLTTVQAHSQEFVMGAALGDFCDLSTKITHF